MSEQVYTIIDLESYASQMREAAANSLCDSCTDNLDEYISINQMIGIVKENCLGFDSENRPMLNETLNEEIFNSAANWIHDVGLAKLAAKDIVECAWDSDLNEMVFWVKEIPKNAKIKPRRKRKDK